MTSVLLVDSPRAVRDALGTRFSLEPGLAIVGAEWDSPSAVVVLTQHAVVVEQALHGMATAVVGKNEGLGSLVGAIRSARRSRCG